MTIEFRSSPTASLGVEVELSLVDRETRALTSAATDTLADISADGAEHPALKHELFESTVEVITSAPSAIEITSCTSPTESPYRPSAMRSGTMSRK